MVVTVEDEDVLGDGFEGEMVGLEERGVTAVAKREGTMGEGEIEVEKEEKEEGGVK